MQGREGKSTKTKRIKRESVTLILLKNDGVLDTKRMKIITTNA